MKDKIKKGLIMTGMMTAAALSYMAGSEDTPKDTSYEAKPIIIRTDNITYSFPNYDLPNDVTRLGNRRENYKTLDSLIAKAKIEVPSLKVPLIYDGMHIDSLKNTKLDSLINTVMNRPMIRDEALVYSILDTVSNYTEVVDKYFVQANIREESAYTRDIVSRAGAVGYGQFMRDTWKIYGEGPFSNAKDPVKNIRATVKYMKALEEKLSKDLGTKHSRGQKKWDELTIDEKRARIAAAYNGGPGSFLGNKVKGNMDKMPYESRNHATKVLNRRTELVHEDLYRNIAEYRGKVSGYGLWGSNMFWLAYDAANTGAFMKDITSNTVKPKTYNILGKNS